MSDRQLKNSDTTLNAFRYIGVIKEVTLLNAVTASGEGSSSDVKEFKYKSVFVISTGVTTGATLKIQGSADDTNWVDLELIDTSGASSNSIAITATGNKMFRVPATVKQIRANITAYTDGTHTVLLVGSS